GALEAARTQSPDLAVALERVRQAENNVQRAWAALQPTLTATGTLTYNNFPATIFTVTPGPPFFDVTEGSNWTRAGTLQFAWNLLNFRAFPALASARQQVDVSRLTQTQQRRELRLSVAATYYPGVLLRELAHEEIAARLKADAWAQFAPSLAVTGTGRYNDPPTNSSGEKRTWAVALSLTLPLYDGGFRYVALKDADSQLRQARAQTRSQG